MTPLPVTVVPALSSPLTAPSQGRGAVTGRVLNRSNAAPVAQTTVYLARVYRDGSGGGVFALDFNSAPRSRTDLDGSFAITDVEPAEYVLVVGDADSFRAPAVLMGADGNPRAFQVREGVATNLGDVRVDYASP